MKTGAEWLASVKTWISVGGTYNDTQLALRINAVKDYLIGAGVTASRLESDAGIMLIAQGVNDTWNLEPGEMKFSSGFNLLKETFKNASLTDVVTCSPADGATDVAIITAPALTFADRVELLVARLHKTATQEEISAVTSFDITGKVVTLTATLEAGTQYSVRVELARDSMGRIITDKIFTFTTEG